MTMIGLKSKSDEVYIVFIDTENTATFVFSNEYVDQFIDLIADKEIVITGKDLDDELDKINKPTKLRVITE